ncbi:MAG TPA: carboxypeptidase-like regulatory domain-containing protein [Arenimonas sp.]|nr:carboxypeptidase-like regulatory domain-containing protein [Arenimonas sp.]HPW31659.1 carboxypeptidase-like regulatory domain-containing protein [Arenimonas sp.]
MMCRNLSCKTPRIITQRAVIVLAILFALSGAALADEINAKQTENEEAGREALPYRDRIIVSDKLAALPIDEDDEESSDSLQRSMHVEWIAHQSRQGDVETREAGIAVGGFWETENWGSFSADGVLFYGDQDNPYTDGDAWRGSATLWQRGLNMPGGWQVNNGLGVLNTPLPNLLREQYRFFLPSVPMLGVSSEWLQRDDGLQIQASAGRGGVYAGARLNGFESGDGSVASLGAQWGWAPGFTGAFSLLATDGRIVPDDQGLPQFQNGETRALLFGNRWQGLHDSFTLNLQASDNDSLQATGAWLDARANRGRFTHRYGIFYLEPDLAWGAFPINNDVSGAYYRLDYQRARWSWNGSLDRIDSISGNGFAGWYSNGYVRYQANPRLGYGGGFSMRESDGASAQTAQIFIDRQWRMGQTRFQYDQAHDSNSANSWQIVMDHSLPLKQGARLSISAGIGEVANDAVDTTRTATVAAYGGFDVGDGFSIDGTVRWNHDDGPDSSRSLDANLALQWKLSSHWSLLGNLTASRGSQRSPFVLDPLGNPADFQALPSSRSMYLSLRYDFNAGKSKFILGGSNNSGSGRVVGTIFLDENGDKVRSATEQTAANITVLLDGRYTVRTDQQGRFEFTRVAVGKHTVTIVPDNLPLPWFVDEDNLQQLLEVEVRRDTVMNIPATRQR